jgi:hypothetical protein
LQLIAFLLRDLAVHLGQRLIVIAHLGNLDARQRMHQRQVRLARAGKAGRPA